MANGTRVWRAQRPRGTSSGHPAGSLHGLSAAVGMISHKQKERSRPPAGCCGIRAAVRRSGASLLQSALALYGALRGHGSLLRNGAIYGNGSLDRLGALEIRDSLASYDALMELGSLYPTGALSRKMAHSRTLVLSREVARSPARGVLDDLGSLSIIGTLRKLGYGQFGGARKCACPPCSRMYGFGGAIPYATSNMTWCRWLRNSLTAYRLARA